ncbi:hypothetical protein Tco_0522952 [Tanacetum coccineum]
METQINVSTPYSSNDSPSVANHPPQPQYVPYSCEIRGNDSHYGYDCPPQVPFTLLQSESDEFIKSSVEDLVPIPSESEGIPDKMCDMPLCENTTPLNALNEHSEIVVNSDDDNSSKEWGFVDPEVGRIDDDILLTIKDDILS